MYTPSESPVRSNFAFMKEINILVSGAAGQSGGLILRELASRQQPVRALARNIASAKNGTDIPLIEWIEGDMLAKDTLRPALEGVERTILISSANDRMVETQCTFIDACKEAGVNHVIKFSGEESQQGYDAQQFRFTREHEQIEDYLEKSGLQWTHLRPSQFMQVYLREMAAISRHGALRLPLASIQMSPVDLRDVAKIAASLLIDGGYHGRSLRITGPEALSISEIARILSDTTGKEIPYVPVSWDERKAALAATGMPGYFLDALAEQTAERVSKPQAFIDISTHQLFDITPTTFAQFAEQHKHIFKQQ